MTLSIKSISGGSNEPPKVTNLRVVNTFSGALEIEYKVEDIERTICRHYLYLNEHKTEITNDVGYESPTNTFRYKINNINTAEYTIQIGATDGIDEGLSEALHQSNGGGSGGGGDIGGGTENGIFGVRVMTNNSNPQTCCTYIENAIGVTPANSTSLGGWSSKYPFNRIRIVGMKNGVITKEIDQSNKTKYIDGNIVPDDVDIMIEIPRFYWNFTNVTNGFEVRISDKKQAGYDCYAHRVGTIEKDNIYVGAYLGYIEGGKLRSKSGVMPTANTTLTQFRYAAEEAGAGYRLWNWYTLLAMQILYLIAYKSLDSQTSCGMGNCGSFSTSSVKSTGGTNTKGMVFGSSNKNEQICIFGIEDLWGNLLQLIDGMYFDGTNILATPDNQTFNDERSGYINIGTSNKVSYGYTKDVVHTNQSGFFPTSTGASETTHFCDYGSVGAGYFGASGGYYGDRDYAGVFELYVYFAAYSQYSYVGSRLCYLG